MSDEQTRLLQQILEVQTEHLAFAKQQGEEFKALQQTALAGQKKSIGMSRFVIWFMVIMVALLVGISLLSSPTEEGSTPASGPAADVDQQP